jgi:chromate transporter
MFVSGSVTRMPRPDKEPPMDQKASPAPTFAEAFSVWLKIGVLSFGGPAAQIALMHREIVEENGWLTERQFLNALSFCMLLPGPEAMQLATYAGWRLHGVAGGLAAGLAFVLPGAAVVLALAIIYAAFGNVPLVEALFLGIKAAVLVIVIEALLRIARRAMTGIEAWAIAALSFIGIFFLALPFPLIVFGAALWGFLRAGRDGALTDPAEPFTVSAGETLRTALLWLAIWIVPLALLAVVLGPDSKLAQIGYFFSKLAVVTFGGAYAVLAYMGQDVVVRLGWLEAGQMMDGLGLAETTPGPLILVTEFVGYLAAWRDGGIALGLAGAAVSLWATFAPCFLWIFVGAPYVEWINAQPRLKGALTAITAAVVGVIANLAIWFALHVFFGTVTLNKVGPLTLWTPDPSTLDWRVIVLAVISGALLLWRHWSVPLVLSVSAGLALVIQFAPSLIA